ncbi:hypothetical protein VTO73DRAFT_157 [Trametes versicolor]
MSSDLQWLLLRKYNSFTVKRVEEGPIFSKEPGNLTNIHSWKYSGLANEKTITVKETETGVQLAYRKKSASPLAVHPAVSTISIRPRSGPRRAAGVTAKLAKRGYRPDLRAVSCHCARVCPSGCEEGKEGCAPEEDAGQEGQDCVDVLCDRPSVLLAFHSHRIHAPMSMPTRRSNLCSFGLCMQHISTKTTFDACLWS